MNNRNLRKDQFVLWECHAPTAVRPTISRAFNAINLINGIVRAIITPSDYFTCHTHLIVIELTNLKNSYKIIHFI